MTNDSAQPCPLARELLAAILAQYALPPGGVHGVGHWARVLENGRRLAPSTGADLVVVQLFAVFHDARRVNEGRDHGHGRRGADLALSLRGQMTGLSDPQMSLLVYACQHHTDGQTEAEPTIQACWDADRLDLGRVGIRLNPELLCTGAARDPATRRWAAERAAKWRLPGWVLDEWGINLG